MSCETCKYTNEDGNGTHCRGCIHNAEDHYKPITNADRIRNMTDEELYKFLRYFGVCRICKHRKDEGCDNRGCTQEEVDGFLKEWLQAEVKEDDSNAG